MSVVSESRRDLSSPEVESNVRGDADGRTLHVAERGAWSLLWLAVLTAGISVWGFWWSSPWVVVLAPALCIAGIGGLVATWVSPSPRLLWLQCCALVAVMLSVLFPEAIVIHTRVFYDTDSAAFDQVAAHLLLRGRDPYVSPLTSAARLLSNPAQLWTYTVDGSHVIRVSYPAGSFLLEVPLMALGLHHMVVDWTDLVAWMVCAALFFLLLPSSLRWLAGLLAVTPIFVGIFSSGGTDAAFLPFLVLAVWRWDRFGVSGAGVSSWLGPVALGLACSIKQTPWFCVPFLAIGIALEARNRGHRPLKLMTRYLGIVVGTFALVNLPFIVWQPAAWAHGTLLPFLGGLVADGQGLVTLATHGLTGGANLSMLSIAALLVYCTILVAWVAWFPALKRVWLLLLPVVFFISPRSLSSYLVDLVPAAIVAAVSVHAPAAEGAPARRLVRPRVVTGLVPSLAGAAAVLCALGLGGSSLRINVDGAQAASRGRLMAAVTVTVRNLTGKPERPHFVVNPGAGTGAFWPVSGERDFVLGPHSTKTVTLTAPEATVAPQHGARWLVEAYTASPDTLSTSALQVWEGERGRSSRR